MLDSDTWGDVITLDILSLIWQAKIIVLRAQGDVLTEVRFRCENDTLADADFVLLYNGRSHYNACGKLVRIVHL